MSDDRTGAEGAGGEQLRNDVIAVSAGHSRSEPDLT